MEDTAHRAYQDHLLARMADVLGLDLELEVDLDRLSRAGLEQAITRCEDCPDKDGCTAWLARHRSGAETAPGVCRNRDFLARFKTDG